MKKQQCLLFSLLFSSITVFSQKPLKEFDIFVQTVLNDWKIPGMAIGIIKDDSIYLSKGYGYRNLEQKLPVTPQTIFPIASVTKTFTGIDLCLLEEEGKVNLQTPVKSYIPGFALYNDQLTNETTLTDLLSHRTGLPSHDALWWSTDKTREQLFQSLKYLQPNKQFRETWQYSNLSFMAAGYILQVVSGKSWENYTQEKILAPLGMTNTSFSVKHIQASSNFSYPYTYLNGNIQLRAFRNLDAVAPCGGINSSVEDMLKYLQMLVQNGKYNNKDIIPENVLAKAQRPVIVMPYTGTNGSASVYGLGFQKETFDKYLLIEHRGEIDGFTSILTLVPEKNIGIIILANTSLLQPTGIIRNRLLENLLKLPVTDENTKAVKNWIAYLQHQQEEAPGKVQKILDSDDRIKGTHPSHALEAYTGEYTNQGYGTIKVEKDGENLKITRYDYQSKLSHYHYDYFLTNNLFPFYRTTLEFKTNGDGFIDQLVIQMETKVKPTTFTKANN
jgi:CubicO group peptidase (beta-lactamase class C family)